MLLRCGVNATYPLLVGVYNLNSFLKLDVIEGVLLLRFLPP